MYKYKFETTIVTGVLAGIVTVAMTSSNSESRRQSLDEKANQAMAISAGSDRIWSVYEQRAFMDEMGLTNVILPEQNSLYLRAENFEQVSLRLRGDRNTDNLNLGTIPGKRIEEYLKNH